VTEDLDLSEPQHLQTFILEQQLYSSTKRLEEREHAYTKLDAKFKQMQSNMSILESNLYQADQEISILRGHSQKQEAEIKHMEAVIKDERDKASSQ
jgi:chromosome segregation ATPase